MNHVKEIEAAITAELADNPESLTGFFAAINYGMFLSMRKHRDHASKCQYAVSAMAAMGKGNKLSAEAKSIFSKMLVEGLGDLDDTNATRDYIEKLKGAG